MFKLLKKIKNWFLPVHEGAFGWSPEEFKKARRWSKNQPHPKFPDHPRMSLWDHVENNHYDSEMKLHKINEVKTKKKKSI